MQREMEIVSYVRHGGIVVLSLIAVTQVVVCVVFCWRARKVKEISWLPKFIMGLASIDGMFVSSYYISTEFFNTPFPTSLFLLMLVFELIS